jgi:hypothetical protein
MKSLSLGMIEEFLEAVMAVVRLSRAKSRRCEGKTWVENLNHNGSAADMDELTDFKNFVK